MKQYNNVEGGGAAPSKYALIIDNAFCLFGLVEHIVFTRMLYLEKYRPSCTKYYLNLLAENANDKRCE
jgi:hypothetical protein